MRFFKKLCGIFLAAIMTVGVFSFTACNNDNGNDKLCETLALDFKEATLEIGEEKELTAIVDFEATNRSVEWSTSNADKVTVVPGEGQTAKIKGIAAGKAQITVTTKDGSNLSATCNVTVKEPEVEKVALVEITSTDEAATISIYNDNTYKVAGTTLGSEYEFIGNYSIADGVMTMPASEEPAFNFAGLMDVYSCSEIVIVGDTAVIEIHIADTAAAAADKLGHHDDVLAKFIITKENADILHVTVGSASDVVNVTGITFSQATMTVNVEQTLDISTFITVAPENASDKAYTLSLKNPADMLKLLVIEKSILGVAEGEVVIVATTNDGSKTAECTVTVQIPAKPAEATNFFATTTTFEGTLDLSAFGYGIQTQQFVLNANGTFVKNTKIGDEEFTPELHGYYTLTGESGSYTKITFWEYGTMTATEYELTGTPLQFTMGTAPFSITLSQVIA